MPVFVSLDLATTAAGILNDCTGCPQVAKVCEELASMPELKGGFNAIGFSQGAAPSTYTPHSHVLAYSGSI